MTTTAFDRLKGFVERIERLREEKKAIGSDERDVFSEAKGVGFDVKAMREVLKRRAMHWSDRDEWDALVDTYEHALGARGEAARIVRAGGTYEEAAVATDLSRATVARSVASRKNLENDTPADAHSAGRSYSTVLTPATVPRTGEITKTEALAPPGEGEGTPDVTAGPASPSPITSCGSTEGRAPEWQDGARPTNAGPIVEAGPMAKATAPCASAAGIEPGPQDLSDGIDIPSRLDRRQRA